MWGHGEHVHQGGLITRAFLHPQILQGLFFDDSYGFYPGQVLIGPAKIFSSVQWLSGVKPVLSTKSKFRVVVEEVGTRAETSTHLHGLGLSLLRGLSTTLWPLDPVDRKGL